MAYRYEKAYGRATILAIGKAVPPTVFPQNEYADFYFDVTNCNHKTALKAKFARICTNSGIKQRYFHCTERILRANPSMCTYSDASLNVRQEIASQEVPRLGVKAAEKALEEWGQPRSSITHLVFSTTTGVSMPGADVTCSRLLGLTCNVNRTMLYQQGCFGGGTLLRVAKDLAENNKGARVLAVVSELTQCLNFRAPSEEHLSNLIGAAIFGDGAAALIIGADPVDRVERPLYEIHWCGQTTVPDTECLIHGDLGEAGLVLHLSREITATIARNCLPILKKAAKLAGSPEWNDLFWCMHPGGRAILDLVEKCLSLKSEKLKITRESLYNYGNMFGSSVLFVLDAIREQSGKMNAATTGEGYEWGIVASFGPGLTIEVSLLKALSGVAAKQQVCCAA